MNTLDAATTASDPAFSQDGHFIGASDAGFNVDADILQIHGGGNAPEEIIKIDATGRLFHRGREVETDQEYRDAMLECMRRIAGIEVVA